MSKKKKISKILICSLSVISIIAMLSLSAFAATYGNSDSGTINGQGYLVFQGATHSFSTSMSYHPDSNDDCGVNFDNSDWITLYGTSTIDLYLISGATFGSTELHNGDIIKAYSQNDYDITFNVVIVNPQPLEKTYAIQFYNNDTYYSSIKVSGISNDETTFSSISSIKYGNTEVYVNGSWVSGYSSTIQYTSETAPDITTLNSELGGIVTFSTQYREPNFWDGVMAAVSSLMTNIGTTANAIVQNEYLSIFCLVLPLLSLAVGLLVRMKNNG